MCLFLYSKKDAAIRRKELLEVVSPPLLEYLRDNAATMAMDKATSVTISDILASACGDLRPAMLAVAQLANKELVPGGTDGQVREELLAWLAAWFQLCTSHCSLSFLYFLCSSTWRSTQQDTWF